MNVEPQKGVLKKGYFSAHDDSLGSVLVDLQGSMTQALAKTLFSVLPPYQNPILTVSGTGQVLFCPASGFRKARVALADSFRGHAKATLQRIFSSAQVRRQDCNASRIAKQQLQACVRFARLVHSACLYK